MNHVDLIPGIFHHREYWFHNLLPVHVAPFPMAQGAEITLERLLLPVWNMPT